MKESLDKESRDSLIAYRIERAYGSLKEAELMAHKEMIDELYPKAEAFIEEVKGLIENTEDSPKQDIQV